MNILVVAATEAEVKNLKNLQISNLDILITGIGCSATIFKLTEHINEKKYDIIINAGIAGSFSKEYKIGDVLQVNKETFGDLGMEDKDSFIPISKSSIGNNQPSSFANLNQYSFLSSLPTVSSITVNTCSGNIDTINKRKQLFNADIENMEGAGVFYVCSEKNIPFIEIRSISNFIEERNSKNWNIPLAISNLNTEVIRIINHLNNNSNV